MPLPPLAEPAARSKTVPQAERRLPMDTSARIARTIAAEIGAIAQRRNMDVMIPVS